MRLSPLFEIACVILIALLLCAYDPQPLEHEARVKTVRLYDGIPRSKVEVAILRVPELDMDLPPVIKEFDGASVTQDGGPGEPVHYEILPGEHALTVGFRRVSGIRNQKGDIALTFAAESDHTYEVWTKDADTPGLTWSALVQDVTPSEGVDLESFEAKHSDEVGDNEVITMDGTREVVKGTPE